MTRYTVIYDDDGKPNTISCDGKGIPISDTNFDFREFLDWNAKQETPLDYTTPIQIDKPAPAPSQDEKIAALEVMVKRLSGDVKQTDEEIDLMVKTGLITEDTAATMKAEA